MALLFDYFIIIFTILNNIKMIQTIEDYQKALKELRDFRDRIIHDTKTLLDSSDNSIKSQVHKILEKNPDIRTVDIAKLLGISKQLAHQYKKQYFNK